ncbi:MAG: hypothetical protein P8176_03520 [Gammaproteobacteria bacterium]|jgi:hypothetical protein
MAAIGGVGSEWSALGAGIHRLPSALTAELAPPSQPAIPASSAATSSSSSYSSSFSSGRHRPEDGRDAASSSDHRRDHVANRTYTVREVPWQHGDYQSRKAVNLYRANQELSTLSGSAVEFLPRINEEV